MTLDADGRRCLVSLDRRPMSPSGRSRAMMGTARPPTSKMAGHVRRPRHHVIYDKLAYEDLLPVRWRPLPAPTTSPPRTSPSATCACCRPATRSRSTASSTRRSGRRIPAFRRPLRLDFKLNLLLDLVGQLLAQTSRARRPPVRFNAMGAIWKIEAKPLVDGRSRRPRGHAARHHRAAAESPGGNRRGCRPPVSGARALSRARRNGRGSHREARLSPAPAKNCRRAPAIRAQIDFPT